MNSHEEMVAKILKALYEWSIESDEDPLETATRVLSAFRKVVVQRDLAESKKALLESQNVALKHNLEEAILITKSVSDELKSLTKNFECRINFLQNLLK